LVSALDEKGRPTPLAATMLRAPMSRMDILTKTELEDVISNSKLVKKYNELIDRESAYEMLNEKIKKAESAEVKEKARLEKEKLEKQAKSNKSTTGRRSSRSRSTRQNPIVKVLTSATFIRGVLGILTKAMRK